MVLSEIIIYVVGQHSRLLQLLHDHDKFMGVLKRMTIYTLSASRLSFKLFYGVFDELTFDHK